MWQRKLVSALVCAAATGAVALAGCSSDGAADTTTADAKPGAATTTASTAPTNAPTSAGPGSDADLATTTFAVDLDQALSVAGTTAPGGIVTKIELDFDRNANTWVWKIDSQQNTDQHEIKIDAATANVLADSRDQESANPVPVDPTKLTPGDAAARATALVPGSVAKWALEYDDGVQRYEFDIRGPGSDTQDVIVDVDTGAARKK